MNKLNMKGLTVGEFRDQLHKKYKEICKKAANGEYGLMGGAKVDYYKGALDALSAVIVETARIKLNK